VIPCVLTFTFFISLAIVRVSFKGFFLDDYASWRGKMKIYSHCHCCAHVSCVQYSKTILTEGMIWKFIAFSVGLQVSFELNEYWKMCHSLCLEPWWYYQMNGIQLNLFGWLLIIEIFNMLSFAWVENLVTQLFLVEKVQKFSCFFFEETVNRTLSGTV